MQLEKLSGLELGTLINTKEVSPVEVWKYFTDRIESRNPSINAFTYTKFEEAKQEAEKLESKIMKGENGGLFAGVPVGLKDFLPSKSGWTNSHGGVYSLIAVDDMDSEFWKAVSSMGAIAYGKTNAPAFGFSGACQNKMYGATGNPFNPNLTSGGSSGGSAAAVADGLLLLAEGGDAGGSIRIPSAWCNLYGFKPSKGTVPSYCRPDGWSATHPYCFNGALTKTVADSAAILNEMAYYNPKDPTSLPINSNKDFLYLMERSIEGMKIGYTLDFDLYPIVSQEVKEIMDKAAILLSEQGAIIEPISFNWKHSLNEMLYCWAWAISVDTALDLKRWKSAGLDLIGHHRDELYEEWIYFNLIAASANISDMRTFNEIRTDVLDNFEKQFETYDLILSPTTICKPFTKKADGRCIKVDGEYLSEGTNFISYGETPLVNFVGYPAASVPAGMTKDNLPIGMQLIGKMFHDEDIFEVARTYEKIHPWTYDKAFNRKIK